MTAAVLGVRICVIALVIFLTASSVACAEDQTISLTLGASTAIALERPFKTVLIGAPNIADVHTINDRRSHLNP